MNTRRKVKLSLSYLGICDCGSKAHRKKGNNWICQRCDRLEGLRNAQERIRTETSGKAYGSRDFMWSNYGGEINEF